MLTSEEIIIESDEDFEIVSTISAGYDYRRNFVVHYYCIHYERHRYEVDYKAIVDEDNAKLMAKRLKIDYNDLPRVLYREFGDCTGTTTLSGIEYVFKEILEFILDCGAKYKLISK